MPGCAESRKGNRRRLRQTPRLFPTSWCNYRLSWSNRSKTRNSAAPDQLPRRRPRTECRRVVRSLLPFRPATTSRTAVPAAESPTFAGPFGLSTSCTGTPVPMDFGPRALRTIQARLVKTNAIHGGNKTPIRYSRTTVNLTCEGIRRIFKWAASHQLLPGDHPPGPCHCPRPESRPHYGTGAGAHPPRRRRRG